MKTFATTTIATALMILLTAFAADKTDAASSGNHINPETESALLAGDWGTVARLLDEIDEHSSSAVRRLVKGHACLALNRHDEAITLFVTTSDSADLKTYHEWAADLVRCNEANGIAHYFAGDAYARLRKGNQARNALDRAIDLDPSFALAYNARGVVRANNNDVDGAWDDFEDAIERNPRLLYAYANLGVLKFSESAFKGAKEAFQGAASISTEATLPTIGRACCLYPEGRWHDAEKQLAGCTNESVAGALAIRNVYGAKTTQIRHDIEQLAALVGTNTAGSTLDFAGQQFSPQKAAQEIFSDLYSHDGNLQQTLNNHKNDLGEDTFNQVMPYLQELSMEKLGVAKRLYNDAVWSKTAAGNNLDSTRTWKTITKHWGDVFVAGGAIADGLGNKPLSQVIDGAGLVNSISHEILDGNIKILASAEAMSSEFEAKSQAHFMNVAGATKAISMFDNTDMGDVSVQNQLAEIKNTYDLDSISLKQPPGGVIAVVDVYKDAGAWNLVVPYGLAYPVADGGVTLAEEDN